MRQNGVDSPYLFLHPGFSIDASLAHTEEFFKKTKRSWTYMRENRVDSPYSFLHCVFSYSPFHLALNMGWLGSSLGTTLCNAMNVHI